MNNTFEWSRFCKVVRKDFSNIWQNAGTSLLIITLLPILAWLLWWALSGIEEMPAIVPEVRWCFIAGSVLLAAIVSPSRMYRTCNLQKEGIYFAMLPASKLEKYLSMLLFTIVICPLLCFVGSMVLDYFLTLDYGKLDASLIKEHVDQLYLSVEGMDLNEIKKSYSWFPKK